jgi:uncharacterized membrane protein YkvA (DUF1232 family)
MDNLVQSFYNWYKATLRNPKYRWLLIGGSLLYLVSPIDIAPDFIPIIGWLDDTVIAGLLIAEVTQLMMDFRSQRKDSNNTDAETLADVDVVSVEVE